MISPAVLEAVYAVEAVEKAKQRLFQASTTQNHSVSIAEASTTKTIWAQRFGCSFQISKLSMNTLFTLITT
jgi:hypothetical protein